MKEYLKNKIINLKDINNIKHLKKIIMSNGVFDLLHIAHIKLINFCKESYPSHFLLIAINSDESVKLIKGKNRPFYSLEERMYMLASLHSVDLVIPFSQTSVLPLLEVIKPDVLIKGGTTGEIEGAQFVESYGGKVIRYENVIKINQEILSTTRILENEDTDFHLGLNFK